MDEVYSKALDREGVNSQSFFYTKTASHGMPLQQALQARAFQESNTRETLPVASTEELRAIDREYLCWGDTVHYQEKPIIVSSCQGGLVFDNDDNTYIDTGMWHSSCNFGYRNPKIESEVSRQFSTLPQACGDFLHREKLLIAKEVVDAIYERTGVKGRVSL